MEREKLAESSQPGRREMLGARQLARKHILASSPGAPPGTAQLRSGALCVDEFPFCYTPHLICLWGYRRRQWLSAPRQQGRKQLWHQRRLDGSPISRSCGVLALLVLLTPPPSRHPSPINPDAPGPCSLSSSRPAFSSQKVLKLGFWQTGIWAGSARQLTPPFMGCLLCTTAKPPGYLTYHPDQPCDTEVIALLL